MRIESTLGGIAFGHKGKTLDIEETRSLCDAAARRVHERAALDTSASARRFWAYRNTHRHTGTQGQRHTYTYTQIHRHTHSRHLDILYTRVLVDDCHRQPPQLEAAVAKKVQQTASLTVFHLHFPVTFCLCANLSSSLRFSELSRAG